MDCELIRKNMSFYQSYLEDESGLIGAAESISFPETTDELISVIKECNKTETPICIQGGKTGIRGGAVPQKGHVLNLSRLNAITGLRAEKDDYLIQVEAGLLLKDLKNQLMSKLIDSKNWDEASILALAKFKKDGNYFWPPNPSEVMASIGGILATGAQGPNQYTLGDCGVYVEALNVVTATGELIFVKRGDLNRWQQISQLSKGTNISEPEGAIENQQKSDLIDLFMGSEGTLGVIVSAELRLIKAAPEIWGIGFLFKDESGLVMFANTLKNSDFDNVIKFSAMEYYDDQTLKIIRKLRQFTPGLKELPEIDTSFTGLIYIEIQGASEDLLMVAAEQMQEIAMLNGCQPEDTWALTSQTDLEKMDNFRHGTAEAINLTRKQNQPDINTITKTSMICELSGIKPLNVLNQFRNDAAIVGIKIAIVGQLQNNRFHINLLPVDPIEFREAKILMEKWLNTLNKEKSGTFPPQDIGKLNQFLCHGNLSSARRNYLKQIKEILDPDNRINQGNILSC